MATGNSIGSRTPLSLLIGLQVSGDLLARDNTNTRSAPKCTA